LVEGFIRVPFGDIEAIEEAAIHHPDIVAIFVEPIQVKVVSTLLRKALAIWKRFVKSVINTTG
jgi:glutamate-1-semialdehyde aminotransferase